MNPKVLFVNSSAELFGGAEQSLLLLVQAARRDGFDCEVVLPYPGPLAGHLTAMGVRVHILALGVLRTRRELRSPKAIIRLLQIPLAAIRLSRIIHSSQVDIVHSNTCVVVAGALAAKLQGKPHIWHVREILAGPLWKILRLLLLRLSDRIVCISSAVERTLLPIPPKMRSRVITIPNGINMKEFDETTVPVTAPGCSVAMIARVNPWKGHAVFLEAAALVHRGLPGVDFYLVGGCPAQYRALYAELIRCQHRLGLRDAVHFVEHLSGPRLRELVASIDVIVLPSTKPEPFGLVIIEAMALRRPVIATAHGGPVEIISDWEDGLLVTPNDPEALASAVVRLLSDRHLRERLGANGYRKVERLYSSQAFDRKIAVLYGSIRAEKSLEVLPPVVGAR